MKKLIFTAALVVVWASSADAGIFNGHTVQYNYFVPDLLPPFVTLSGNAANGNYVVPATGINGFSGIFSLDLQDDGFTANFQADSSWTGGRFNGFRITDIEGTISDFTSFSVVSNTALIGSPELSFDADHLFVNWRGLSYIPGSIVFSVNAIPEPEIYAMMAAGLGLMGWVTRRRKQQLAA
jgi:hypothetical protein